ncbi:unnamed protein product [marine sediment metagenome]|uniref:Uncharacterized protein n=1 Tax=marine sediment metagenome TaxID=412755 RepID=X0RQD2_9ZZZZ
MNKIRLILEDLVPQKRDSLAILLAIEMLDYHDKNYLGMGNKALSRQKIELIMRAMDERGDS